MAETSNHMSDGIPLQMAGAQDRGALLIQELATAAAVLTLPQRQFLLALARALAASETAYLQTITEVEALRALNLFDTQSATTSMVDEALAQLQVSDLQVGLDYEEVPGETMLASEAVLSRDWLGPEEDEAWRDL